MPEIYCQVDLQVKEFWWVSAVVDEPARRASSRQMCCKQRWTLSVINTELNWQRRRRSSFSNYSKLFDESANFNLPHLHLAFPLGWPCLSFAEIFGIGKLESVGYRVTLFVWSYIKPFYTVVERRLVAYRYTHDCGIYRASMASRGKNRLAFGKVRGKSRVAPFPYTMYIFSFHLLKALVITRANFRLEQIL